MRITPLLAPNDTPKTANSVPPPDTSKGSNDPAVNPQATEKDFLKLLVAQLQNQDPLSPVDGTQFLSQLTEINSVEQLVQVNSQLSAIRAGLTTQPNNAGTKTNT